MSDEHPTIPWSKPYPGFLKEGEVGGQERRREILEENNDGVLHRVLQRQGRFRLVCWSAWMPLEDCEAWEPPEVDHAHVQMIARGVLRTTEGYDDCGFDGDDMDILARAYLTTRGASTDVSKEQSA